MAIPYDISRLETRCITYKSKDGTEIPMYITCKKDLKLNGKNPVVIHGYGGYGHKVEPSYNQFISVLLLNDGVLAVPNVRGGGAYGQEWALAGRRLKKQNTIDDFIAAAEYLIEAGYTQPEKVGITGASHGGLLVAAAFVQRPDLFKAVVAEAGPYDMLRFHQYTVGGVALNLLEFGDPNNEEDYRNIRSYSPYFNLKKGVKYPNVLLITGDTDDRVPPLHTYKFLARLQELGNPESLYVMYVNKGAGHGGALTEESYGEYELFKYYFLLDQLDVHFY